MSHFVLWARITCTGVIFNGHDTSFDLFASVFNDIMAWASNFLPPCFSWHFHVLLTQVASMSFTPLPSCTLTNGSMNGENLKMPIAAIGSYSNKPQPRWQARMLKVYRVIDNEVGQRLLVVLPLSLLLQRMLPSKAKPSLPHNFNLGCWLYR